MMTDGIAKKLHQWIFDDQTVDHCLAIAAGPLNGLIDRGFTFTPANCRFCVLSREDGSPELSLRECNGDGVPIRVQFNNVFELRLFGEDFELHWVRSNGAKGRITVSTDDDACAAAMAPENLAELNLPEPAPPRTVRCLEHQYLLWGKEAGSADGWTKLTSARIGAIWVPPVTKGAGTRIVLQAREYFATGPLGNVAFIAERMIGFRRVPLGKEESGGK